MDHVTRRRLLIQAGATSSYLLAYGCIRAQRPGLSDLTANERMGPSRPLKDKDGALIRYHITSKADRDIDNLLRVYGHICAVMMSAIPQDQARATRTRSTPGLFAKYLPELVASNRWEPFSWWSQARTHLTNCAHGTENFIYWHRPYIFFFEKAARQIAKNIVKFNGPERLVAHADYYNNWTLPVFHWEPATPIHSFFFDSKIIPPPVNNPETGTGVARMINSSSRPNPREARWANFMDVSPRSLENILSSRDILSFTGTNSFAGQLEGSAHGGIHVWVGGQMGAFFSPLDPIFWTHHAMVDFLFEEFLTRRRNEGQTSRDFLPNGLANQSQVGFYDVNNGNPVQWRNAFLIEKGNHMVTYDGLTKLVLRNSPASAAGLTELNLDQSRFGFKRDEQIYVDNFSSTFVEVIQPGDAEAPYVRVLRGILKIAEDNLVLDKTIALLEAIQRDLINNNQDFIDSVVLRFRGLGSVIVDPYLTSLQIEVGRQGFEPFVSTSFVIFSRFGAKVTVGDKLLMEQERAKELARLGKKDHAQHAEEGNDRGFMIDLVPVILRENGAIDFSKLIRSDSFVVDFVLARLDENRDVLIQGPEMINELMNKSVKIDLVITRRPKKQD